MAARERDSGSRWLVTLLGVVVLVAGGFAMGLVVGVVSQEPDLVVGHLAGRSEELHWAAGAEPADGPGFAPDAARDVAAAPPAAHVTTSPKPPERAPTEQRGAAAEPAGAAAPADVALAPAAVSAPPQRSDTGYSIQVGAFAESATADGVAGELSEKGLPVYVTPGADSGDRRWRVRVGPFATRPEAAALAQRLKTEEGLPTWVLAEEGR